MAAVNLIGSHDYALVALSVLIAMFASYAALDLAGRVTAAGGWTRAAWLLGGAGVMGAAIPVMHYTGMAAASFTLSGMPVDLSHAVSISTLGTAGIAAVTFV